MRFWQRSQWIIWLWALTLSTEVWAAADSGSDTAAYFPTFFLDTTFGFTTFKSKLVDSNDTGTGLTYSLGGNAGVNRNYGFILRTDSSATTFALNESKVTQVWQDTIIRYRLGYFYLGVLFDTLDFKVNSQGTELLDVAGSGMGGNAGFFVPIGRIGSFYLDATSVTLSTFRNVLATEVKGGSRMDIDLGANFDVTKQLLDFVVGYRQRTMSFTTDQAYAEAYYITYLGFRFAVYF